MIETIQFILNTITSIFEQMSKNNLLIQIIGTAIGAFIAVKGSLYIFHREMKEKRLETHFNDIKKKVLEPSLEAGGLFFVRQNEILFEDLKNHYPELISLNKKLRELEKEKNKLNLYHEAYELKELDKKILKLKEDFKFQIKTILSKGKLIGKCNLLEY